MLLLAIVAALAVVVAVAVGVLTVATGGMGLVLLGAVAGLVGGVIGAVVGGLLCGHKMGPQENGWEANPILFLQEPKPLQVPIRWNVKQEDYSICS
jgi:uncharacterized membrane protein